MKSISITGKRNTDKIKSLEKNYGNYLIFIFILVSYINSDFIF